MTETHIKNPDGDPFVTALLVVLSDELEQSFQQPVTLARRAGAGTKGPVVEALLVGLATNAVWDVFKLVLNRLRSREDYRPDVVIDFEGHRLTLTDCEGSAPKRIVG